MRLVSKQQVRLIAHHPSMMDLVAPDAVVEELGTGFRFLEGPVWNPEGGYLLVSDVIGNARHRWHPVRGLSKVAAPTGHGNGMTLDAMGNLIVCEGVTPAVSMCPGDGSDQRRVVLVDRVDGGVLNSPNDVVVASDGAVYFTDPWHRAAIEASADDGCGAPMERDLELCGVYRLEPGRRAELVISDIGTPNGLCFGPGERVLYVNDSDQGEIHRCDLDTRGRVTDRRVFAAGVIDATGHVDGMKCDVDGNVWVTGPGGIWVFTPGGECLGVIEFAGRVGNFHWGGPDWDWLYVANSTRLVRLRTATSGRREPFMRST